MKRLALLAVLLGGCVGVPSPLAPSQQGTVGVPQLGVQTGALELPERGSAFVRYRPTSRNYWGVPRLVNVIQAAARHVDETVPGGARLVVGDLSARYGGKIRGHSSHRSGRDVDLLYYVTTPSGAPVESRGFVSIAGDTLGFVPETGEYVRLDLVREWELVKFLLSTREVGVQFLFMSRNLEALLIEYALARGEPLELVHRAQAVLLQPSDSTPHDDHVHLRIACSPEESISGCSGGGPYWEWLPAPEEPPPLDAETLAAIAADDPVPSSTSLASAAGTPGGV